MLSWLALSFLLLPAGTAIKYVVTFPLSALSMTLVHPHVVLHDLLVFSAVNGQHNEMVTLLWFLLLDLHLATSSYLSQGSRFKTGGRRFTGNKCTQLYSLQLTQKFRKPATPGLMASEDIPPRLVCAYL